MRTIRSVQKKNGGAWRLGNLPKRVATAAGAVCPSTTGGAWLFEVFLARALCVLEPIQVQTVFLTVGMTWLLITVKTVAARFWQREQGDADGHE